jgi:hypothetical protein
MTVPLCIACATLGIGEQVEQFYSTLLLMPWWKFGTRPDGRQTGRSTHGMLEAIALARVHGIPRVTVSSPNGSFALHRMRDCLERYAKTLGVEVEVSPYRRGELRSVNYADHGTPCITGDLG